LVAGEADDQVAAVTADADTGGVDESCVMAATKPVLYFAERLIGFVAARLPLHSRHALYLTTHKPRI